MKRIDKNWMTNNKWILTLIAALAIGGLLFATLFRGCNKLGIDAREAIYTPDKQGGFIGKSDQLLKRLVDEGNANSIKPRSLAELNRKYPALRFELPYHEDSITASGRASDLRLVEIIADSIKNEEDREFYYNSSLPSLLEKQRASMGEQMFTITLGAGDYTWIKGVRLIPSLFKVALEKDPWVGVITATENVIMSERDHCFLTWGKSMAPIRLGQATNDYYTISADIASQQFRTRNNRPIDFYDCHRRFSDGATRMLVRIPGGEVIFCYTDPTHISIKSNDHVRCHVFSNTGRQVDIQPTEAGGTPTSLDFDEDLKIMAINVNDNRKIAEFTLTHHNPMLMLSRLIHSNAGTERYIINSSLIDRFTNQVVNGLATTLRNTQYRDTVRLTIDPILSMELERMMREYKEHDLPSGRYELSMTVIDMATGNVIAAPFYRSIDNQLPTDVALGMKSPTLIRRYVGSAFKPLLSLAAVEAQPTLLDLNTVGCYNPSGKFFDWQVPKTWDGNWNGCTSMTHFLGVSDDVYPVAMAVLAMNGGRNFAQSRLFRQGWRLVNKEDNDGVWTQTPLMRNISLLYDVKDNVDTYAVDSLNMTQYIWNNLELEKGNRFGLDILRPDITNMHYDSFYGGSLRGEIVPWVLGQGNNYWCPMKFAEAWTRMLTKRKFNVSIIKAREPKQAPNLVTELGTSHAEQTWNRFLDVLAAAQQVTGDGATLRPMYDRVIVPFNREHQDQPLVLFAKTGTPNNYQIAENPSINHKAPWIDLGTYCMGLMTQQAFNQVKNGGQPRGVMCVIQIVRIQPSKGDAGIWGRHARDLFSNHPDNFTRFYELTKKYY